jgi:hypothetical protein
MQRVHVDGPGADAYALEGREQLLPMRVELLG